MPIRVVTPSVNAPVAITTALRHVRALEMDVDLVQLYLLAATEAVEDYTGRALLTKTYCLDLEEFPSDSVELRRSPLSAIDSVKYYIGGVLTTWNAANYRAEIGSLPGKLHIVDGVDVPDVDTRHDAVQIQFQAGQGTREHQVDPMLRLAVLEFTSSFYENRTPIGDVKMVPLPFNLKRLLRAKKI